MTDPYLLLGFRLADPSSVPAGTLEAITTDVENALGATPITALSLPDVYVVQLTKTSAFEKWEAVSRVLDGSDTVLGGQLQWFAHLADRRGCELAFN